MASREARDAQPIGAKDALSGRKEELMKLGLAQTNPLWEEKEKNFQASLAFLEKAKEEKVDFLLFPEMSMTGFSMRPEIIGEGREASKTLRYFQRKAKEYGLYLGVGYVEQGFPKSYNCYAILSPKGQVLADYRKIHPFSYGSESLYYQGGDEIVSCQVEDFTVTPFICYDLRFPEIFQAASEKSQLIVLPANWPSERQEHFRILLQARAIENQCYLAGVNRTGRGGELNYQGGSLIVDPYGVVLGEGTEEEMLVTAEIQASFADQYRREFPVKKDRRRDMYVVN